MNFKYLIRVNKNGKKERNASLIEKCRLQKKKGKKIKERMI